jgi:hypothetical protein
MVVSPGHTFASQSDLMKKQLQQTFLQFEKSFRKMQ